MGGAGLQNKLCIYRVSQKICYNPAYTKLDLLQESSLLL